MRPRRFDAKSGCAVGVTLSVIGGMWKPLILFHLFAGKKRFMELSRAIPNATQRILTLQLRELEADGVIVRHAYPQFLRRWNMKSPPSGRAWGLYCFRFGVGASSMEVQFKASRSCTRRLKIAS